jgi:hypothetical protein
MSRRKRPADPPAPAVHTQNYQNYNPFDAHAAMWPQNTTAEATIDKFNTDQDPFVIMCKEAIRDPAQHAEWTQMLVAREMQRKTNKRPCLLSEAARKYQREAIALYHVLQAPSIEEPPVAAEYPDVCDLYTTAIDKMRRMPAANQDFDLTKLKIADILEKCEQELLNQKKQALTDDAKQAIRGLHDLHVVVLKERLEILDKYTYPLKLKKEYRVVID